jgi:hypothetical protein
VDDLVAVATAAVAGIPGIWWIATNAGVDLQPMGLQDVTN